MAVSIREGSISEILDDIVGSRLETIDNSVVNDLKHKEIVDKELVLEQEIRQLLGEKECLYFELDSLTGSLMSLYRRYGYKHGMADGISLCLGLGLSTR